jgi:hypothetical protein
MPSRHEPSPSVVLGIEILDICLLYVHMPHDISYVALYKPIRQVERICEHHGNSDDVLFSKCMLRLTRNHLRTWLPW